MSDTEFEYDDIPEEVAEEIKAEEEDEFVQHLGQKWRDQVLQLANAQLQESLQACELLKAQLDRERRNALKALNAMKHRQEREFAAAMGAQDVARDEALAASNKKTSDARAAELDAAAAERQAAAAAELEASSGREAALRQQIDGCNQESADHLKAAKEQRERLLAAAAAEKFKALREAREKQRGAEAKLVADETAHREELLEKAAGAREDAKTQRASSEEEMFNSKQKMAASSAAAAEEKTRLETEATQAALLYLQKLAATEAAAASKLEAEQAKRATLEAHLATAKVTIVERDASLLDLAEIRRKLEEETADAELLIAETNETLRAERVAQKQAKAEWDMLSRSALDEMFELRKKCATHAQAEAESAEFVQRMSAKQHEEQTLIDNYAGRKEVLNMSHKMSQSRAY